MTFRSPNKKIELEGVRHVEGVVQNSGSIFRHFEKMTREMMVWLNLL